MKIQTEDLEAGVALDYALAKCAGHIRTGALKIHGRHLVIPTVEFGAVTYQPSKDAAQRQALINQAGMRLYPDDAVRPKATFTPDPAEPHYFYRQYGSTAEIAALKCIVACHLGDVLIVPDELCQEPPAPALRASPGPSDPCDRPMADKGLQSYRCKGTFGWIMIGARDAEDALSEARRSFAKAEYTDLQEWDGKSYVPVESWLVTNVQSGDKISTADLEGYDPEMWSRKLEVTKVPIEAVGTPDQSSPRDRERG